MSIICTPPPIAWSLRCLALFQRFCGTHSDDSTHTHRLGFKRHTCQSSSHHTTSLSCVARLCWGVDSEGCFINLPRVHLISPAALGWREVMIRGIFRSLCSIKLTVSPWQCCSLSRRLRAWQRAFGKEGNARGELCGIYPSPNKSINRWA